jgi:hypothetical protein
MLSPGLLARRVVAGQGCGWLVDYVSRARRASPNCNGFAAKRVTPDFADDGTRCGEEKIQARAEFARGEKSAAARGAEKTIRLCSCG